MPEISRSRRTSAQGVKVAFLDRDGVINEAPIGHGYVQHWGQFRFADGALDMLKALADLGYRLVVVTNQQGVGKGLVDPKDLGAIHRNMCAQAGRHGAEIAGVFFCPHLAADNCDCRKPKPGLIHQAVAELGEPVNLAASWMIGDSERDIEAGAAAGLRTLLVGPAAPKANLRTTPTAVAANLCEIADRLRGGECA